MEDISLISNAERESLIEFLKVKARESKDPINWLYALEEALISVTENFDWLDIKLETS